jgi:hypothetical protein
MKTPDLNDLHTQSNGLHATPIDSAKPLTATAAMSALEIIIFDNVDAARLLGYVVESVFSHSKPDANGCFLLGQYEVDILSFAQRIVSNHASDAKREWEALQERAWEESRAGKAVRS